MFTNSFRSRYPQYDMDLWSTAMNVGTAFGLPLPDPAVVSQPASCAIARSGESISLQLTANGSLLRYQWRLNGVNLTDGSSISGATTPTLTLSPVGSVMGGTYQCLVTTCDGSKAVLSATSQLTVFEALATARPYLTWGENNSAQCGNGTYGNELPPAYYTGLTNVVQAGGGRTYSFALRSDGSVYTWGRSSFSELGNGFAFSNVNSPQLITANNGMQVAAGKYHVLAVQRSGAVIGWGYNFYGEVGDLSQADRQVPTATAYPGCFVAVAAGDYHSLALRADGTVWSSGYGGLGSLGTAGTAAINTTPAQIPGLTGVVAIAAGGNSSYALKSEIGKA